MAGEDDRTEAPSPRRLQKAREQGDVPVSRELPLLVGLAAGLVAAASLVEARAPLLHWFAASLAGIGAAPGRALDPGAVLRPVMPVAAAVTLGVAASVLLQTRFLLRPAALRLHPGALSPARGLKRIFGTETAWQLGRAVAKLAIAFASAALAVPRLGPAIAQAAMIDPRSLTSALLRGASALAVVALCVQAVFAGADLAFVRFRHARKLRMSRHDLREEARETDGNPEVRRKLRQVARLRARRRMMAAVPKAAVVVTNPTHYAVALGYERGSSAAPRVIAKGVDDTAARIREIARDARVPVIANPPLARALYRVEIDTEIPAEHFKAVAEIIAYVWRLAARPPPGLRP